jgi:3D (Asp-Asp-Asp) domain-containing protein
MLAKSRGRPEQPAVVKSPGPLDDGIRMTRSRKTGILFALLAAAWLGLACAHPPLEAGTLLVTATAYNSLPGQTEGDPSLAAWGDRLEPGMRAIAVSRDLLALGLAYRSRVRIEGLPGEYLVLDKMGPRWQRRIDIYMGNDREAALLWGKRSVRIAWSPESASLAVR